MSPVEPPNHLEQLAQECDRVSQVSLFLTRFFLLLSCAAIIVFPFKLAFSLTALLLAYSRWFYLVLLESKIQRERLQTGMEAEAAVYEMLLKQLPDWSVEPNVKVPGCGDIDLFVVSPFKRYYAIEVKSHKTDVVFDGQCLRRGDGRSFEKDFLNQATRAAIEVRKIRNLSYVNAVLVFTRATLSLPSRQILHVNVLKSNELVNYLISQERPPKSTCGQTYLYSEKAAYGRPSASVFRAN